MATVNIDVLARVQKRAIDRATDDLNRGFARAGSDAGKQFATNFSDRIEASGDMARAFDDSTAATRRLRDAQDKLNAAYRSGDPEQVIRATERLARVHRNAATETQRMERAQRNLHGAMTGGDMQAATRDVQRLSDRVSALGQQFSGLGKAAGPVGIAAIVPALGALAGVAAQATGAIGLLPGVVGSAASAFGTLKIATMGVGDALENIADPAAFAEALETLSPNAQRAAMSLRGMLPALEDLQAATQDALFAGMGPQLETTLRTVTPAIQQLTTGVAGGLNQALAGVMGQLTSPEGMASLQSTINSIVQAFQNLAPAAAPFTQAMLKLTEVGSSFMPQLASATAQGAQAFADFIDEASRTGQLQEFIEGGIEAMRELGPITLDVLKTFLAMAPIGQAVLPLIRDTVHGISVAMPPIAEMAANFSPLFITWGNAVKLVGGAFDIVKAAANAVIPVVNAVGQAVNAMLGPVKQALDAANALPGISLPTIPDITPIPQIGTVAPTTPNAAPGVPEIGRPGLFPSAGPDPNTPWDQLSPADRWLRADQAANPGDQTLPGTYRRRDGSLGYVAPPSTRDSIAPAWTPDSGGGSSSPLDNMEVPAYSGDPMQLLQGFAVDSSLYSAAGSVLDARQRRAEAEAKLNALEADNESTAAEIQRARNEIARSDREAIEAEIRLNEAKASATKRYTDNVKGQIKQVNDLGLDQDLGLSRGLPGLVENIFKGIFGAIMSPITNELKRISGEGPGGHGMFGIAGQNNLAAGLSPILGQPLATNAGYAPTGGYPGDAALLANVPAGRYTQDERGDLTQGLADCSSAVEDLVNLLDGRPTGGASMSTHNADEWLRARGFLPGRGGPGDMRVGFNSGHMQATLPGGTPFNWGSQSAANRGGVGGTGADDPAFTSHYYRPVAPSYGAPTYRPAASIPSTVGAPSSVADLYGPANTNPGLTNPSIPSGGGGLLPGMGMPQSAFGLGQNPSGEPLQYGPGRAPNEGGWQPQGGGFNGLGGMPMAAISSAIGAAGGASSMFGGQAAGAAAETAMKAINRTIGYGGQAAGIAAQGLLETFTLSGSALGDPNKSLFGRILSGFVGARPASPGTAGMAGETQKPLQPKDPNDPNQQGQKQQGGPLVHIENFSQAEGRDGQGAARDVGREFRKYEHGR